MNDPQSLLSHLGWVESYERIIINSLKNWWRRRESHLRLEALVYKDFKITYEIVAPKVAPRIANVADTPKMYHKKLEVVPHVY